MQLVFVLALLMYAKAWHAVTGGWFYLHLRKGSVEKGFGSNGKLCTTVAWRFWGYGIMLALRLKAKR